MRSFKTDAIVLKRKNIGEADKLITVLTKRFGKVQVKAKGVRKINSKRSPHIEPLNFVTISIYKGKNAPILCEAEVKNSFSTIKKDLKKVAYCYYVCELVDCLCPSDHEQIQVFNLLENTLLNMSSNEDSLNLVREFELKLLQLLGYLSPSVKKDTDDLSVVVEQIIEKKLKTKQILPRLI